MILGRSCDWRASGQIRESMIACMGTLAASDSQTPYGLSPRTGMGFARREGSGAWFAASEGLDNTKYGAQWALRRDPQ